MNRCSLLPSRGRTGAGKHEKRPFVLGHLCLCRATGGTSTRLAGLKSEFRIRDYPGSMAATVRKCRQVMASAGKGFGLGTGTQKAQKVPKGYVQVAEIADFEDRKAVTASGKELMLFKVDDAIFCTDALSTAYKFPLVDAKIQVSDSGPVIEVPLDGTKYDLKSGAVVEWCPKNNWFRNVLGGLKENEKPIPLKVYPVIITGNDSIFVGMSV